MKKKHDYKKCGAYQIKESVKELCIGGDGRKCKYCPAYIRYKKKIETCAARQNDIANIMNRINDALEGTGYVAIGYDNTDILLHVLIEKETGGQTNECTTGSQSCRKKNRGNGTCKYPDEQGH
jgi:hypothetical protein